MKKFGALLFVVVIMFVVFTATYSGHEAPFYPSYYPQEIRIEQVDPASAVGLLREAKIHAYVGDETVFEKAIPDSIGYVGSLGSYIVLTLNPASPLVEDEKSGCAATQSMARVLAEANEHFFFHPYPINPFHAGYLYHFDLVDAAKKRYLDGPVAAPDSLVPELKVKAKGVLANQLIRAHWQRQTSEWDVTVEQIDAGDLVAPDTFNVNGWLGPPWVKKGWFHAHLLLADALRDPSAKARAASYFQRLQSGDYDGTVEKVNLERSLLSLLTTGCRRVVVGYTVKKEYFNSDFSAGVENIAYDSHAGFNSPIFIRTVKLKDLPWNGWLRLGMKQKPSAAWNPIGGFTDDTGRLIWFALGDPALFPEPYDTTWVLNRIGDVQSTLEK
ncbi:MAG: hypothetical protein ACE5NW_12450 [Acidiferrobacterales bacterium]